MKPRYSSRERRLKTNDLEWFIWFEDSRRYWKNLWGRCDSHCRPCVPAIPRSRWRFRPSSDNVRTRTNHLRRDSWEWLSENVYTYYSGWAVCPCIYTINLCYPFERFQPLPTCRNSLMPPTPKKRVERVSTGGLMLRIFLPTREPHLYIYIRVCNIIF